ncbi:MAG: amidohydrolase family protein [Acidobacteriaceae bacterium]
MALFHPRLTQPIASTNFERIGGFMRRRDVLKLAASAGAAWAARPIASALSSSIPIIDSHIHLFDTSRPGGVPWPQKSDSVIYKPALPGRYAKIAEPLGVVGAIAIEASPLTSDNDWVLRVVADNPIMVGMVGDLIPGSPSYLRELDRLHANPLFLGIRYGNLWNRDLELDMKKPGFLAGLKRLAELGLELDSANPNPALIRTIADISDRIPDLRIVIDHLPSSPIPIAAPARREYWSRLRHLSQNPRVFIKLSEIPVRVDGVVPMDPAFYKPRLDAIWDVFGEDHILYGSDWPNSDHLATYAETLAIVRGYVAPKGHKVCQKFFWQNSIAAYKWHRRLPNQRVLSQHHS